MRRSLSAANSPADAPSAGIATPFRLGEADETGGRMLTIGVHALWMGQPTRASGRCDVIEHVKRKPGVAFMRREDIARYWVANHENFERWG